MAAEKFFCYSTEFVKAASLEFHNRQDDYYQIAENGWERRSQPGRLAFPECCRAQKL
jgi:hypothetical protein